MKPLPLLLHQGGIGRGQGCRPGQCCLICRTTDKRVGHDQHEDEPAQAQDALAYEFPDVHIRPA